MKASNINVISPKIVYLKTMIAIMLLIVLNCTNHMPTKPSIIIPDVNYNEYSLTDSLQFQNRPWYTLATPIGLEPSFYHDDDGVIVSQMDGQWYYHPWQVLYWGLAYLSSYQLAGEREYLELAESYSARLMLMGNRVNNSIYFPYQFNHVLHGGSSHDVMMAPWYSGLAQGMALCFYSRFYELTGDMQYKYIADTIFQCYLNTDTSNLVWTSRIDSSNYYWVEEYPFDPPDQVLNGFQTAIICLYDYYKITHSPECKIIFEAGCTTLEYYFDCYRCPGGISYYCLRHKLQFDNYHNLHITQFEYLFMITGDSSFLALADTLRSDY